jgi:hypothetical protein
VIRRGALAGAVPLLLLTTAAALGAGTSTGTLTLREGEGADAQALAYRWTGAPLQTGPAASRTAGLPFPIRNSDTRYIPATLESFAGPVPWPPSCAGFTSRPVEVLASIAEPRAILQVDGITLDLRRGRGYLRAELARTGADAFRFGEYPAPGLLRVETRGCVSTETGEPVPGEDGGAFLDVRTVRAAAVSGSDRFLGYFASDALARADVPLRRRGGAWRGTLRRAEADAGRFGPASESVLTIALRGTPAALHARCHLPPELYPGRRVRSRSAAVRLMRAAGFPRVRVGRNPTGRGIYRLPGITTSVLPCDFPWRVTAAVPLR